MTATTEQPKIGDHPVVTPERWLTERNKLIAREKELTKLRDEIFRARMGWKFKWVSSNATDFNFDFHVSFTPDERAKGDVYYNFTMQPFPAEEAPGISLFYKNEIDEVFHTYSTFGRGVEVMMGAYDMMDLAPKGRSERDVPYKMEWVRHHDRYEPAPAADGCCGGGS